MVKLRLAGVGSGWPTASTARTLKVCGPFDRGAVVSGESHPTKPVPSNWHSKVDPGSFELNANVGVSSEVLPDGPESIVVTGGIESVARLFTGKVSSPALPMTQYA